MSKLNNICKICNTKVTRIKKHLSEVHNLDFDDYLDIYLRDNISGYCKKCNNKTRFSYANRDFVSYCCDDCKKIGIQEEQRKIQLNHWQNISEDEYNKFCEHTSKGTKKALASMNSDKLHECRSKASKAFHANMAEDKKQIMIDKIRKSVNNVYNNWTEEDFKNHSIKTSNGLMNRSDETKQLSNQRRSNTYYAKSNEEKSKLMNKSHRPSSEELYFMKRCDELSIQYKYNEMTDEYPYFCDFIIDNLYIELNITSMHGGHWFDINNIDDKKILDKISDIPSNWYQTKIKVWTKTDIDKRDYAINHNLNYIVLWNHAQIDMFFDNYLKSKYCNGFVDYNTLKEATML